MREELTALWNVAKIEADLAVPFDLDRCTAAVFRVGSHSHGTYIPPAHEMGLDDVDLMVICVPPPEFKLGMKQWDHGHYQEGPWDIVFYDWQKWMHLLVKSNPNVVGTLWLEDEDYLRLGWHYVDVRCAREKFLSKEMYPAFIGYARAQLHKMTHHATQGYMGEKRKRLVEQFGYDVKNAAHLVRLLRMACEAFETGRLLVRRPDAAEIRQIKLGEWSLQRVQDEANSLFERALVALHRTELPDHPDVVAAQEMMVDAYRDRWGWAP